MCKASWKKLYISGFLPTLVKKPYAKVFIGFNTWAINVLLGYVHENSDNQEASKYKK